MKRTGIMLALAVALALVVRQGALAASTPRGSITIDRVSEIKYPTNQSWSPDNKTIAFLWDVAGKQDLYTVRVGEAPMALTDFPVSPDTLRSDIGAFEWVSNDRILFAKDGSIWSVTTDMRKPMRLPDLTGVTVFAVAPGKQLVFVRGGQIWLGDLEGKLGRQLTHLPADLRFTGVSASPDGKYVAFNSTHTSDTPDPLPFNGNRVQVLRSATWGTSLGIVSVQGGDPVMIASTAGQRGNPGSGPEWVIGPAVMHQEMSADRKTRKIEVTSVTGETRTIWTDYDPAWWSPSNSPKTVASPDGKWVAFICDRTGWPLVYVIPSDATAESQAKQVSFGKKIDGFPAWSLDSKRVAYANSRDGDEMSRYISIADVPSGKIEEVVKDPGVSLNPVFSQDGSMIAFSRSSVEHPLEVYAAPAHAAAAISRLTNSMPPEIKTSDLTPPVPIWYPSRGDKKLVPATLMVNSKLDRTRKHPAIIWVHGSGDGQNYLGWQPGAWRMY